MAKQTDVEIDKNIRELLPAREKFRKLLLQGKASAQPDSSKAGSAATATNSNFEEIGCVGYQPQTERLEAVVYINQPSGYGGGICGPGTPEYVRFYASFNGGTTWDDLGLSVFTAWDVPEGTVGGRRLEYAVTRRHSFRRHICLRPQILLIRAILSWNAVPPTNTPDHIPFWGDIHNTHILVQPRPFWTLPDFADVLGTKIPPEVAAAFDPEAFVAATPKAVAVADLQALYKGQDVPATRFAFHQLKAIATKPGIGEQGATAVLAQLGLKLADIDWDELFGIGDGNTSYEKLESIGYDPADDSLVGVIRLKRPSGFSGGPCTSGSLEHVTFWADLNANGFYETCIGTASVRVYDIADVPKPELEFAVHLPADLLRLRMPCQEGPVIVPIRAILSWAVPVPCATPDATPTWGNRLETLVHVRPGRRSTGLDPLLSRVGGIPSTDIDGVGYAQDAVAVTSGAYFNDAPFGGRVELAGKIIDGLPTTRYRPMIREAGVGSFVPLALEPGGITLFITTPGPVTTSTTIHAVDGYYAYQDYSASHYVEGNVLASWATGAAEHGKTYELRIDVKDPGNPAVDIKSNVVTVHVDNVDPLLSLSFTSLAGDCAHFPEKTEFTGAFSVEDPHFGRFSFEILPTVPAAGVLPNPPAGLSISLGGAIADPGVIAGTFTLDTDGMSPCGYALVLHAWDRTNVNSGFTNNYDKDSVGFCLGNPPPG